MPRLVRLCIGYLPDAVLPPERPKALCSSAAQPAHSANASPHAALATSGDLAARAADAQPLVGFTKSREGSCLRGWSV